LLEARVHRDEAIMACAVQKSFAATGRDRGQPEERGGGRTAPFRNPGNPASEPDNASES
jgi:hypothetical protein